MKLRNYVALAMLLATPAWAQQTPQSLNQQIGAQIGALVIENASLRLQIEQIQTALKVAQDRMKALEDKYEPKKDAPK